MHLALLNVNRMCETQQTAGIVNNKRIFPVSPVCCFCTVLQDDLAHMRSGIKQICVLVRFSWLFMLFSFKRSCRIVQLCKSRGRCLEASVLTLTRTVRSTEEGSGTAGPGACLFVCVRALSCLVYVRFGQVFFKNVISVRKVLTRMFVRSVANNPTRIRPTRPLVTVDNNTNDFLHLFFNQMIVVPFWVRCSVLLPNCSAVCRSMPSHYMTIYRHRKSHLKKSCQPALQGDWVFSQVSHKAALFKCLPKTVDRLVVFIKKPLAVIKKTKK